MVPTCPLIDKVADVLDDVMLAVVLLLESVPPLPTPSVIENA